MAYEDASDERFRSMMPRWHPPAGGTYRDWLEAFLDANERWTRGAFEAQKILLGAARRSGEDAGKALTVDDASMPALRARSADLARAQTFLWAAAGFAAGERLGRAAPGEAAVEVRDGGVVTAGDGDRDGSGGPLPGIHDAPGTLPLDSEAGR